MSDFWDHALIHLLPFWSEFFSLLVGVSWPLAILIMFVRFRPMLAQILSDRAFSLEGFGAQLRVEDRSGLQRSGSSESKPELFGKRLQLPRTVAIDEMEKYLTAEIEKLPIENRNETVLNALAIDRLEKNFALTYINIFGSQLYLLNRLNERGGQIALNEGLSFFSDIKVRFPEFSDWDFDRYLDFLVRQGLLVRNETLTLTPQGREFLQFVVRMGLRADKPL